jgi:hypothetical protein
MQRLNGDVITAEENETTITVNHFEGTFSVYTTAYKVSNALKTALPDYFVLASDGASSTANGVPIRLFSKVHWSTLK